jgi:uncharacterized protein
MPVLPEQLPLLVVSASGRALAHSARRGGHPVVVLDLFNDMDVREMAQASCGVASARGKFDARRLLAAARLLCPPERCAGLVYGSGFESRTELLANLAVGRELYGNAPDTVARIKDPAQFFALLDALDIAHPDTQGAPPADVAGWLVKRTGGAGGSHVRPASARHLARAGRYFQKIQSGRSLSVLFVADGHSARVIGLNEQWTAGSPACAPYCYGGAVSGISISPDIKAQLMRWLDQLVRASGLVGLNGLDFLLGRDQMLVLEINPRPTATINLYDADYETGLLALHLQACRGALPDIHQPRQARAHAIVYALEALRVASGVRWPKWCTDIPQGGSLIPRGAPICSVHAEAATSEQARALVMDRHHVMHATLIRKAA